MLTAIWLVGFAGQSMALGPKTPFLPLAEAGSFQLLAAGGATRLGWDWQFGFEGQARYGITPDVELAFPLGIGIRLIDAGPGSVLYGAIGATHLYITSDREFLWTPSLALAAGARLGAEAALRAAIDLTGVEQGLAKGDHPAWFRSAVSLVVDVGPFVTISLGIAFQRLAFGGEAPPGADETGWVGNVRFSIGAVASQPLFELPTIAIHFSEHFSAVGLFRFDANTDINTNDLRLLVGVLLRN